MDHEHYAWSALPERAPLRWPNGATVALGVVVSLDHMEWAPPEGSFQAHNLAGGLGRGKPPDYARLTHREYGHRVGIFRVLETLRRHDIPVTVACDLLSARHYPWLVRHCLQAGCEFIAHGQAATRMITSRMTEDEERQYIAECIDGLEAAIGVRPRGWFGIEYGESDRTPALLAELGIRYVLDWVNDEQPYRMTTPTGDLHALPMMLELDDVHALWDRKVPLARYERLLSDSCEVMAQDGGVSGRSLLLHLHPWLIGQPYRIGYLDRALEAMVKLPGVWCAHAGDIVEAYRQARSTTG
jgi:peptidoglycan/xylan/chitin deacetylase (PgdA/CDA1 family)